MNIWSTFGGFLRYFSKETILKLCLTGAAIVIRELTPVEHLPEGLKSELLSWAESTDNPYDDQFAKDLLTESK